MNFRLQSPVSPYCDNYKTPNQPKGLIMQHLIVRKLTRRELEDKYLRIIDENYDLKRENNMQKEKIKVLTTKLLRLTKETARSKSRQFMFMDGCNEIREAEEVFFTGRPATASGFTREITRNSTPNLASRYKSDFFREDSFDSKQQQNTSESSDNEALNKEFKASTSHIEEQIMKLTGELKKIQENGDLEKQRNAQLEIQVNELKEKLTSKSAQEMSPAKDSEVLVLNQKLKQLETQLNEAESSYNEKIIDLKKEQESFNALLEKERLEKKKLQSQALDMKQSQKMIDGLMEQIDTIEKEKAALASQHERFAKSSEEQVTYKKKITEMSQTLATTEKALEKERSDKASIEHSQEDLLKKMKDLQKENDQLVTKLEGLKTENEGLLCKNRKLEDRIKNLESENKQQLKQINETLSLPVPQTIESSRESLSVVKKADTIEIAKTNTNLETTNASTRIISPTPSSTTNVSGSLKSEARTSSLDKRLEVSSNDAAISDILEASHASKVSSIPSTKQVHYKDESLHSPEALTIINESVFASTSGTFAETFSRSVSKDAPSEDEFDPNTFSVDQVSDAEGISELIDDEGNFEYLLGPEHF